jgi:YtcA family
VHQYIDPRAERNRHTMISWNPDHRLMRREHLNRRRMLCGIFALSIAGCNPVISVAGAQFPVWMLCLFAGILVALALRPLFVATGLDDWMTPRPLIYSCLALAIACLCWLASRR